MSDLIKRPCVKCSLEAPNHYYVYGNDDDKPLCHACLCEEYLSLKYQLAVKDRTIKGLEDRLAEEIVRQRGASND